jgi:hypothetical protein
MSPNPKKTTIDRRASSFLIRVAYAKPARDETSKLADRRRAPSNGGRTGPTHPTSRDRDESTRSKALAALAH